MMSFYSIGIKIYCFKGIKAISNDHAFHIYHAETNCRKKWIVFFSTRLFLNWKNNNNGVPFPHWFVYSFTDTHHLTEIMVELVR